MKKLILILLISLLVIQSDAACTTLVTGKCCCDASQATSVDASPGTGVATCPKCTNQGSAETLTATTCAVSYYMNGSNTCTACAQGLTSPAGSTAIAACVPCADGKASLAAGAACTDPTGSATPLAGIANGCRVFAAADKQTCSVA